MLLNVLGYWSCYTNPPCPLSSSAAAAAEHQQQHASSEVQELLSELLCSINFSKQDDPYLATLPVVSEFSWSSFSLCNANSSVFCSSVWVNEGSMDKDHTKVVPISCAFAFHILLLLLHPQLSLVERFCTKVGSIAADGLCKVFTILSKTKPYKFLAQVHTKVLQHDCNNQPYQQNN